MFRCVFRPAFLSLPHRHRSSLPLPFRSRRRPSPRAGGTRGVMKCHDLSCDVMFRGARRPFFRVLPPLHRSSFPLPASGRRGPFSRVSHVRAGAPFAPARFARLIARASQAQGTPILSVPLGFFFAPARDRRRSGLRMPLRPVSFYHGFFRVKPYSGIISPTLELVRQVGRSCPDRPPVEPVPPRGDAFGQRLLGPAREGHWLARDLAVGRAGCGERGARRRKCAGPRPLHDPRRRDRPTGL